jgi:hypothetical protein
MNAYGLIGLAVILIVAWIYFSLKEDVPKLYVNEIMANNMTCCPDKDSGREEFDDWIEIYNAGKDPVDIGGMYVSQDRDNPLGYQIPKTNSSVTTIQPGGFLVLWADGDTDQGELHLKFKLSHNGEFFGLYYNDGRTIDSLTFDQQLENVSFGRSDGGPAWKEFNPPTRGSSNK